jgi:carbonic anhydrase/acetyltransferase-like protein (isoleucine patch superfamily)
MIHNFEGRSPLIAPGSFVAWNAEVSGEVELGEGASIWFGAVLRGDLAPIRVGEGSNVQDGAILHVSPGMGCSLGEGVTVGHGAIVHACTVGDYCLIGMGAIILDGAQIGAECIVGAGTLITQGKHFPPRSMIFGSPAKLVRELTEDEIRGLHEHAAAYRELAAKTDFGLQGKNEK